MLRTMTNRLSSVAKAGVVILATATTARMASAPYAVFGMFTLVSTVWFSLFDGLTHRHAPLDRISGCRIRARHVACQTFGCGGFGLDDLDQMAVEERGDPVGKSITSCASDGR